MLKNINDLNIINNFSRGECSPRFFLRNDVEEKKSYVIKAENVIPYLYGGLFKRAGLVAVGDFVAKEDFRIFVYDDNFLVIIRYQDIDIFDVTTEKVVANIKNNLFETSADFANNIKDVCATKGADSLFFAHHSFHPMVLKKTCTWEFTNFFFSSYAFLDIEISSRNATVSVAEQYGNNVTLTLNFINEIEAGLYKDELLSLIDKSVELQFYEKTGAGVFFIYDKASITLNKRSISIRAEKENDLTFKQASYPLEIFSFRRRMFLYNYPSCVLFHESRLIFGVHEKGDNILHFSKINNYSIFKATSGDKDTAFYAKIISEPGEKLVSLVSGAAFQVFTNKHIYIMQNSGIIPLEYSTFVLNKVAYNGGLGFFSKNKNNETIYVGTDNNLYCLQKKGVSNFEPLNLSLLCNKKDIINIAAGSYYCSYIIDDNENLKKIEYIIVIYNDGTCGVVQFNNELNKLCWSTFNTKLGNLRQAVYLNDNFYFVIEDADKENKLFKFDIQKTKDMDMSVDVCAQTFPLLPFCYTINGEISKIQGVPAIYILFEGDEDFFINDINANTESIINVYGNIRLVKIVLGTGLGEIINLTIRYSGAKDFKLYGIIMHIVRS